MAETLRETASRQLHQEQLHRGTTANRWHNTAGPVSTKVAWPGTTQRPFCLHCRPLVDVVKRWQATLSHKWELFPFVCCIRLCMGRISHVVCTLLQSSISVASCGLRYLIHVMSNIFPGLLFSKYQLMWLTGLHVLTFPFTALAMKWKEHTFNNWKISVVNILFTIFNKSESRNEERNYWINERMYFQNT